MRGIFDLSGGTLTQFAVSFGLVAFVSFMAAVAAGITARLILLDGEQRFGAGPIPGREPGVQLLFRLVPLSAPLPLLFLTVVETYTGNTRPLEWIFGFAGMSLGIAAFFLVMTCVHDALWDLAVMRNDPLKADEYVQAHAKFKPNSVLDKIASLLGSGIALARKIVSISPKGDVVPTTGKLRNRHVFALMHLFLSLVFYVGLYLTKWNRIATVTPPEVPTLCLVLALILLGCFALTGLTFFFDRFRVPLLSLMVLYGAVSGQFAQRDHFYFSRPADPPPIVPAGANRPCQAQPNSPVVLVAASGGGIQSAAWTALVLSGLKQDLQEQGSAFDCSIKVISSVSGGSVGAMYFADAYSNGSLSRINGDVTQYDAVRNAERSSLDAVAWGLAYPDVAWTVAPILKGVGLSPPTLLNGENLTNDRGTALENAWRTTEKSETGDPGELAS